jgi:peptidoglycan/LPS O-acetylase OafA/YrhL
LIIQGPRHHATKRRIHDLKFHRLQESLDLPKTSAKQPGRLFPEGASLIAPGQAISGLMQLDTTRHSAPEHRALKPDQFRLEIAGLRAIAVISVVLFHLKIPGFQGGFVGVDIFFVISGYLITRNILADARAGRFSFADFYVRRTRRIYPALAFTIGVTYILGALWCSPSMFRELAKECTHALLSIANIQYWRQSFGYFAPNSDELALLHFWSLSAEEQFYLVWPVLIVLAHRINRTFAVIAAAGFASLVAAALVARSDPSAVFFLMPFRIYEFAIGALVLLAEKRMRLSTTATEGVGAAGLVGTVASVLLFDSSMPHLEIAALLPCLGAAAMIWAGSLPRISAILTNPIMVGIGAISYSLYLCHWPIIFFGRFIFGDDAHTPSAIVGMIALMLACAVAMYLLVERRFIRPRGERATSFPKFAAGFGAIILPMTAVTHATFLSQGLPWRMPAAQAELAHLQDFPDERDIPAIDGPLRFALVGDSFATQYLPGLSSLAERLAMKFDAFGGSGCPILDGIELTSYRRQACKAIRDEALRRLSQTSVPIIIAQKWKAYSDAAIDSKLDQTPGAPGATDSFVKLRAALERTFGRWIADGRRILVIGDQVEAGCAIDRRRLLQGPLPHKPPPPCPPTPRDAVERVNAPIDEMLGEIQAKWPDRITIFRPRDFLCDSTCPVVKDGVWLYFNASHFSVAGSRYLVSRSEDVFSPFLKARE